MTLRRRLTRAAIVGLVAVVLVLGLFATGFRVNLQTSRVAVPGPDATPGQVVTTWLQAWNARDFSTLRAISPDQGVPSRLHALGRYADVVVTQQRTVDDTFLRTTGFEGHRYAVVVSVTMTAYDMEATDLAYPDGPGSRQFLVLRDRSDEPWRIVEQGFI